MSETKYSVEEIESLGVRCKFESMGAMRDGWIMPDGHGVDYAGFAQLRFEPKTISTDDKCALKLVRIAVAQSEFEAGKQEHNWYAQSQWVEQNGALICLAFQKRNGVEVQLFVSIQFLGSSAKAFCLSITNATDALDGGDQKPCFTKWHGGGWYVSNLQHTNGTVGCVFYSMDDHKWHILWDHVQGNKDAGFKTRGDAARAEQELVRQETVELLDLLTANPVTTENLIQPEAKP
tara:strand:+ start:3992 stop:4693 length:702 start_codon:yes stop_codon:yes gene_type:complete